MRKNVKAILKEIRSLDRFLKSHSYRVQQAQGRFDVTVRTFIKKGELMKKLSAAWELPALKKACEVGHGSCKSCEDEDFCRDFANFEG